MGQILPIRPIHPQWEYYFKYDTSSPPLSTASYVDLYELRYPRTDAAGRAYQREIDEHRRTRTSEQVEAFNVNQLGFPRELLDMIARETI